jgi:hypothetical protein
MLRRILISMRLFCLKKGGSILINLDYPSDQPWCYHRSSGFNFIEIITSPNCHDDLPPLSIPYFTSRTSSPSTVIINLIEIISPKKEEVIRTWLTVLRLQQRLISIAALWIISLKLKTDPSNPLISIQLIVPHIKKVWPRFTTKPNQKTQSKNLNYNMTNPISFPKYNYIRPWFPCDTYCTYTWYCNPLA